MLEYIIKYTMDNMPEGYVGSALKWARNADEAVKLILAKSGWKNNVTVVFKKFIKFISWYYFMGCMH